MLVFPNHKWRKYFSQPYIETIFNYVGLHNYCCTCKFAFSPPHWPASVIIHDHKIQNLIWLQFAHLQVWQHFDRRWPGAKRRHDISCDSDIWIVTKNLHNRCHVKKTSSVFMSMFTLFEVQFDMTMLSWMTVPLWGESTALMLQSSILLSLCERNPLDFSHKGTGKRSSVACFVDSLNKLVNKGLSCQWIGMPWCSCDVTLMIYLCTNVFFTTKLKQERLKRRNTLGCLDQYAAQNSKYARPPIPSQPPTQKVFFQWHTQYDPTMKHSHCETVYAKELFQWLFFELAHSLRILSILPTYKPAGLTKECQ